MVRAAELMPEIIGRSPAMDEVRRLILQAAPHEIWVLILGKSGTGKELVARALHRLSRRAGKPFVTVNCAALTDSVPESELFGIDDKVASAVAGRPGLLEQANGGTLFLDEVGDIPMAMQVKLLRVLQEGELVRVGSKKAATPIRIDVRIVAATNKDLEVEIEAGRFRDDPYWRLAKWIITTPPLRERGTDVLELAEAHAARIRPGTTLSRKAGNALLGHTWGRGNIRELQAVVERACVRASGPRIGLENLDDNFIESAGGASETRGQLVLDLLGTMGPTSAGDLRERSGFGRSRLSKLLRSLVEEGRVSAAGKGKACRYFVVEQLVRAAKSTLSPRQQRALDHVREAGRITRAEYAALVGVSLRTASRNLAELVEAGKLTPCGAGKRPHYLIAD